MPAHILALIGAIIAEVIGTASLQASQQFTRPLPSALVVLGYGAAFYLLSLALNVIPVGIAYAIWSGLGTVLIALLGVAVFGQRLDLPAVLGLALIIAGVVIIQVFSSTSTH
ncbi:small multidrug resistance pump [Aliiruegeria haliotis]|uniref:Small multidrug resistance pump n=1 Tax=Aliiruegeria haliotis TaxID=1280846 RepID=A0A2T0RZK6_9RHOB|nr:SMR family transporter [Aliiruegeria haliotis]PRY26552.1 small multidrug resistance pump [Aliiruegeria haliotis]